jgi:cyclopropane fatty-acyl-phospholipid synthase-like methyltransferase
MTNWVSDTSDYYGKLLKEHGPTPASVDTRAESQQLRFGILAAAICDAQTILDVGCGYGAFLGFLIQNDQIEGAAGYTGIDVSREMIEAARAKSIWPSYQDRYKVRNLLEEPYDRQFEAVVASGIFQLFHDGDYANDMIEAMWRATGRVLAFNMLSVHAKEKTPGEAYFEPGTVLARCQRLTPYCALDHTYKENDFTVVMERRP